MREHTIAHLVVTAVLSVFVSSMVVQAQSAKDLGLVVSTTVEHGNTPSVTLSWQRANGQQSVGIWRKAVSDQSFPLSPLIELDSASTSFTDDNIVPGWGYDYKVAQTVRRRNGEDDNGNPPYLQFVSYGYVASGIDVVNEPPGTLLVLVDSSHQETLQPYLDTYKSDCESEGWTVEIRTVPRTESFSSTAVEDVRMLIRSFASQQKNLEAVLLVGRVAVPYSGYMAPDGHVPDHLGAWPADGIYGDLDGLYTDNLVNTTNTSRSNQTNVPDDGKYDQSVFSGTIKVAIGRVDFYNMPEFQQTEQELLKRYFDKNHRFRSRQVEVINGGIIDNGFGSYAERFAAMAYRSFPTFGGKSAVKDVDWFEGLTTEHTYLWAYGCGGGKDTSAGSIGSTREFAITEMRAIHTQIFGSYFGDWNTKNNFMRAALASSPSIITVGWGGRPAWYLHNMALGKTIGYSLLLSQNNSSLQPTAYIPNRIELQGGMGVASVGDRQVHIALMGDPTLKAYMSPIPEITSATANADARGYVHVMWDEPPVGADGYVVYRKSGIAPWVRITSTPVQVPAFFDSTRITSSLAYRVHACTQHTSASGTYYDVGKGAEATLTVTSVNEERPSMTSHAEFDTDNNAINVLVSGHQTFASISLITINAQIVGTATITPTVTGGSATLDASKLANGIYMVVVKTHEDAQLHSVTVIR